MPDLGFAALMLVFFALSLVHRWVCKVYFMQPAFNHPPIFWNPILRWVLCIGTQLALLAIVVAAFFFTKSPWWFLATAFMVMVATTPTRPRSRDRNDVPRTMISDLPTNEDVTPDQLRRILVATLKERAPETYRQMCESGTIEMLLWTLIGSAWTAISEAEAAEGKISQEAREKILEKVLTEALESLGSQQAQPEGP